MPSGYWQVSIDSASNDIAAFVTAVKPFGLTSSPSTFEQ